MTTHPLLTVLAATGLHPGDAQVLEAALEQFALTGVRRTSTDDIARRAGLNRATLYRRLGTKADIVGAAFLHEAGRVLTRIDAAMGPLDDVDGYIVAFFTVTLTTLRENRLLSQLLAVDRDETLQALTVGAGRVLELASSYLADQIRRIRHRCGGRMDPDEIAALAGLLARLTQSLLLTPEGPPHVQTPAEMHTFARSVLVPMIRGG